MPAVATSGSGKYSRESNGLLSNKTSMKKSDTATSSSMATRKEEPLQFDKITRHDLRKMKGFQKLVKKQLKEKETLKSKQNKEKALMQKQHCSAIDKMTTVHNKKMSSNQIKKSNSYDVTSKRCHTFSFHSSRMNTIEIHFTGLFKSRQSERRRL